MSARSRMRAGIGPGAGMHVGAVIRPRMSRGMGGEARGELGVTLVELLAALLISAIIVAAASRIFLSGNRQYLLRTAESQRLEELHRLKGVLQGLLKREVETCGSGRSTLAKTAPPSHLRDPPEVFAMKVTIERAELLKSLGHVHRVVERRNTIPILANVLIKADKGKLSRVHQMFDTHPPLDERIELLREL